jgi:hypothetical protein
MDTVEQLTSSFDATGIRFHDRAEALAKFRENHIIEHTNEGAFTTYDGERVDLATGLTRWAYDHREVCDARTLPREGAGAARPGIDNKTNYPDAASKAKYIRDNGFDAWERLPVIGPTSNEVLTKQDWYKLPRAEKVRRLTADAQAFEKLPNAPPGQRPVDEMVIRGGAKINVAALERQRKIRHGGR